MDSSNRYLDTAAPTQVADFERSSSATPDQARQRELAPYIRPNWTEQWAANAEIKSEESLIGYYPDAELPGTYFRERHFDDLVEQAKARGSKMLSVEEVQKQYGIKTDQPLYPEIASQYAQNKATIDRQKEWRDRGGEMGWFQNLSSGATQVFDPFNMATMLLTGLAGSASLRLANSLGVASLGTRLEPAVASFMRLGSEGAELVGKAKTASRFAPLVTDAAVQFGTGLAAAQTLRKEGEEISTSELLADSIAGSALFHGASYALRRGFQSLKKLPYSLRAQFEKDNLIRAENNLNIVDPPNGPNPPPGSGRSNGDGGTPVQHPSDRQWYSATNPDSGQFVAMDDYGFRSVTDSELHANAIAGNKGEFSTGRIEGGSVPKDARFINADEPLSKEAKSFVTRIEESFGFKILQDLSDSATFKDVLNLVDSGIIQGKIRSDAFKQIEQLGKAEGFSGFHELKDGQSTLSLFEPEHFKVNEEVAPNKEAAPDAPSRDPIAEAEQPESSRFHSEDAIKKVEELAPMKSSIETNEAIEILKQQEADLRAEAKLLAVDAEGNLDPSHQVLEEIKQLDGAKVSATNESAVVKQLADCIEKGTL